MTWELEYRDENGKWAIGATYNDRVQAFLAYDEALEVWDKDHVRLSYHRP